MSDDKDAIRRVEEEVLDEHHKGFAILLRPDDVAIEHLLKMYGEGLRHYERTKGTGVKFRRQRYIVDSFTHGLAHCFRWIANQPERSILLPDVPDAALDQEARELLLWSAQYDALAADHIAWSRGYISAEIDETSKIVTFSHPREADATLFARQIEAQQSLLDLNDQGVPYPVLQEDFQEWLGHFRPTTAGVEFPWNTAERSNAVQAVYQWLMEAIWPQISPATDLGGFTLADFRQMFASLYTICLYRTWLEDIADRTHDLQVLVQSQPLASAIPKFAQWLTGMSGVSALAIAAVFDLLTLDTSSIHSKVSNQPIIRSKSGEMFLLPRLLTRIDLSRMLAGALNKGGRKDIYDRVSQQFERITLDQIEAALRQDSHIEVAREKTLRGGGDTLTPDFLIFGPQRNALLVVEYKHALVPYSTADVDSKMREYTGWRTKLRRYCDFVKAKLAAVKPHLPSVSLSDPPAVSGMILTRWPLALPVSLDADMVIADWSSLRRHLATNESVDIAELQQWAKTRPDVNVPKTFHYASKDVSVGEWTYRQTMIRTDESEPMLE